MAFILSILPILLIIYLMVRLRWSAARAGAAGYLSALIIAITFFGTGPELLAIVHSKALFLAIDVLLIIWAAFLFFKVCDEAGAIRTIGEMLPKLNPDRGIQALLVGWVFVSFLQGVGGFGVPVAVTAPILVGIGFNPLLAVVLPSLGHGWAVTFGSLGSSFQALINVSGVSGEILAPASAIFLGSVCLITGPIISHATGGWQTVRRLFFPTMIIGIAMALTQYWVATAGFWNIGSLSASLIGLLVSIPLAYYLNRKDRSSDELKIKSLAAAFSGYFIVVGVILVAKYLPPISELLQLASIQIPFPETVTTPGFSVPADPGRKIYFFSHTGMLLFYAAFLSYLAYWLMGRYRPGAVNRIVRGTFQRVLSSSVSIISMISMAVIMEHAGMTDTLARGLATGMGTLFPIISPWIGALGAFMTGSNTNSNVLFGGLQKQIAELIGFSIPVILAAQTTGASIGSIAAPTKIVIGLSTLGMVGREGDILRLLVGYVAFLISLASLLTVLGIILTQ